MTVLTQWHDLVAAPPTSPTVLFIREQGCKYCEAAEQLITSHNILKKYSDITFYQTFVDSNPDIIPYLGLTGVPAFLILQQDGRRRLLTGLEKIEPLEKAINDFWPS